MTSPNPSPNPVPSPTTPTPATPNSTQTPAAPNTGAPVTTSSALPTTPDPNRPADDGQAALFDAVAAEHAAIYGYGMVSAHSSPDENPLVADALAQHRERREDAVALLEEHSITVPIPAAGYQLPIVVGSPTDAANLAIRMEDDCAVAWRAVLEHATSEKDRELGVAALTASAVLAARWRQILGAWPVTVPFPGGNE